MQFFQRRKRNERGQAMVEFLLIMLLALTLTRYVYYNREFGFKGALDKMMLKLGVFLEQNLKSGVGVNLTSSAGQGSSDKFMGLSAWKN
jgi:hypothetical protein